jgi:hypothetical protein
MAFFRSPFGFDPDSYGNQGTGGLAALLQQAIEQQRWKQQADKSSLLGATPDRFPADADNSPGLFARLLVPQSYRGSLPAENSEPTSPAWVDPNFRQLSRLPPPQPQEGSAANSFVSDSNPDTERQVTAKPDPGPSQVAQALVPPIFGIPYTIFARPPLIPRNFTPLEQLPKGSSGGEGAGQAFPRFLGRPQEGEAPPPCIYCGRPTTLERGGLRYNRDHIIPRKQGGNNGPENLGPSCQDCNLEKGGRTPEQWYLWRQET